MNSLDNTGDKGLVFNIQRFSVHDGPGIRTTVFLKGCPLSCLWCSNPESQSFFPSLAARDINCKLCGKCIPSCPKNAISILGSKDRIIDGKRCDQCLRCVDACISGSLKRCGEYMTEDEILTEVMKDSLFYKNSRGGVTLSGGEPLSQSRFLIRLLHVLKEKNFHVALDTSGHAPGKVFAEALPFVDLVLFDIKHMDDEAHRRYTGASNRIILSNARQAAKEVRTWFRIPLIEGINDSADNIARIAEMAKEIGIEKISFLPYHEGGISKCLQIGRPYPMAGAKSPSEEHIRELRRIISEKGVSVSVGS
jgi:pyruvate formate lyase activating enzyme